MSKGHELPLANRIVLLGGPGQGKSTLGQFLAQLARARILGSRDPASINPETRDLTDPILRSGHREGLQMNGPARWPIRVDLPGFADALKLADDRREGLTLIKYIAVRLSRDIDAEATPEDVRLWLGVCPSLIVLDGLDEVPPTANRRQVIEAINALWDDIGLTKGDTLVIVTTRPQGYNHDLDPRYWEHWELVALDAGDTIRYASRLADVRISSPERQQSILDELRRATSDAATSALLTSPLQVAILFGIAFLKQSIPRDRWDLFHRYYSLLRDREAQKPGSIVREYQRQIDALHQQAGFVLHVAAESAGNANAFLTPMQFKTLIENLLRSEEFEESRIQHISNDLLRVATERLVLLAARVQDRIAFDVRSLQEFMAAAQITAASSVSLAERLRAIARSAHWRHPLRIAASKVFSIAELGHYRADILGICHALDNGDLGDESRLMHAGAKFALDLLCDGVAASAPGFQKQLVRRALSVLDLGPDAVSQPLVQQFSRETADVFAQELVARLQQNTTPAAVAAFSCASKLLRVDEQWAERLLLGHWPAVPHEALVFCAQADVAAFTSKLKEKFLEAQLKSDAERTLELIRGVRLRATNERSSLGVDFRLFAMRRAFLSNPYGRDSREVEAQIAGGQNALSCRVTLVERTDEFSVRLMKGAHPSWAAARAAAEFAEEPSKRTLAQALTSLASTGPVHKDYSVLLSGASWVLNTLVHEAREGTGFTQLAQEASDGDFGDLDDWRVAQERWQRDGLGPQDFLSWTTGRYLTRRIARVGAPYLNTISRVHHGRVDGEQFAQLVETAISIPPQKRGRLLETLLFAIDAPGVSHSAADRLYTCALALMQQSNERGRKGIVFSVLEHVPSQFVEEVGREADWLGRTHGKELARWLDPDAATTLSEIFSTNPKLRGLLPLIMFGMARSLPSKGRELAIKPSAFQEDTSDEPRIAIAVAWLRVWAARFDKSDAPSLALTLGSRESSELGCPLASLMKAPTLANMSERSELLTRLAARTAETQHTDHWAVIEALTGVQDARPSPLQTTTELERLKLPAFALSHGGSPPIVSGSAV